MLEFKIAVDDLDYGAVAQLLLSIVKDKAETTENKALKLLFGMANAAGGLSVKAVNALPQKIKDDMVVSLVNSQQDRLIEFVENKAAGKNIVVTVNEISAERIKGTSDTNS